MKFPHWKRVLVSSLPLEVFKHRQATVCENTAEEIHSLGTILAFKPFFLSSTLSSDAKIQHIKQIKAQLLCCHSAVCRASPSQVPTEAQREAQSAKWHSEPMGLVIRLKSQNTSNA